MTVADQVDGFDLGPGGGFAFVGRSEELRLLVEALRTGPAVVLVEGGAGGGKSRLVAEALAETAGDGLPVLRGWCHPLREPLPFGPVIDALHRAAPHLGSDVELSPSVAVLAPYLREFAGRFPQRGPGADPGEPIAVQRQQLMRAVHELLGALGAVVLVVEDVHWADEGTAELLLLLARNPPPGLRLVLTYREDDLHDRNALGAPYRRPVGVGGSDISLAPLTEALVRELAASVIGETAAGVLGRQLFERSGGLPLAAEEDLLVLAGRLGVRGAGRPPQVQRGISAELQGVGVPRALQEAMNSRLAGLGKAGVAVVQAAAVLEVPATEELLAVLTNLEDDELEEGLTAAVEAGVLRETSPGCYGFWHVLARQAVYDKTLGPRRRRLHRRAIDALDHQEPPPLVQIAHHTRQLGDPVAWIPRAVAAADHAVELGDDGVAADLLQQLLDEPVLPPEERTRAALALSRIAARRVDPSTSVAVMRRIVADPALPTATRGEIRLNLGRTLWNQGADGAAAEVEKSVGELKQAPGLAAIALASLGMGSQPGTTVAQDMVMIDRAVAAASDSTDPLAQATVLASRITLLETVGDPLARDLLEQLPTQSQDPDILRECARALHNAADGAFWRADDERARTLLDEAEQLARRCGVQWLEAACDVIRLELDYADGQWDDLDARIEALAPGADERSALRAEPLMVRTLLDLARGRWPQATKQLGRLLEHLHSTNVPQLTLVAIATAGRVDLARGDPQTAWSTIRPTLDAVRHKGVWTWATDLLPTALQAALGCGLREEAQRLTAEAETGIEGHDAPGVTAEVLWCRGMLAAESDPGSAVTLLEHASTRLEALGRVPRAARVTEQTGMLILDTYPDNPGRAAGHLQNALDSYTRFGATADAARCQQTLRQVGQERPEPRGRPSYGQQLSPREQQVAALLATGATNQDIANALALSLRTAEHHVASVLKKLDTTRDRLTGAL
ncbi:ATP-binding protein [Kitasatospora herbaricolor]|uniref:ATP-binding protein n=1 Tax=Kitasatospora herbaricolor TaxID=68217 RepID=UPI0036DA2B24